MIKSELDTITAIATPIGEGGIAVIRVSGAQAIATIDRMFEGKKRLIDVGTHTAHVGWFTNPANERIDEVVCLVFRAPASYTGEDVVEISCHGGLLTTRRILETIAVSGVRQAEPGEFTKRAFLQGKMDLAQAEAVADLIRAKSDAARNSSLQQLQGRLSEIVREIRGKIVDSVSLLELELDFVEDGYEFVDKKKVLDLVCSAEEKLESLLKGYYEGRLAREGVKAVLVGSPNVGKSSLLNALLKEDRAIVTEIPGTTRDTIEEVITINGVLFRLVDTAGLRQPTDFVEEEGIRRTNDQIHIADIILFLVDASRAVTVDEQREVDRIMKKMADEKRCFLLVANKVDIDPETRNLNGFGQRMVKISATREIGIDQLKKRMSDLVLKGYDTTQSSVTISNLRHAQALDRAKQSLENAKESLMGKKTGEFVVVDLRSSLESLVEIIGEVTSDEILESIFSKFCIGK